MADKLMIQFVRGTTAAVAAYTGPAGTFAIDLEKKQLRLQDGVTAGGTVIEGGVTLQDVQALIDALNITSIDGLEAALAAKVDASLLGQANGVATLDATGRVPAAQLPSYVDDVEEYADVASLPVTGESGKIYVALDTGRIYRWSGSAYVNIVANPGTTDNVVEGVNNLYFTEARARAAVSVAAGGDLQYNAETGEFSVEVPVTSVAGRTGDVVLTKADVGLDQVANLPVATQLQAETADTDQAYLTPLGMRQMLEHIGFSRDGEGNWTLDQGVLA